jgi:Chitobiase/beta-hexosaminidase C-terminal domain
VTTQARKRRRSALAAAGMTTLAAAAAAPAGATHVASTVTGEPVAHNLSIFHNLDFVAVSGFAEGDELTIRVSRPGVGEIASLTAAARPGEVDGEAGLELNHGPEGAPLDGDCWTGHVPDILPGDTVSVSYPDGAGATATDADVVDNIQITRGAFTAGDDVAFEGIALDAAGDPIDVARLDSGETRADGAPARIRAAVTRVVALPGVPGGFRALHERAANYGVDARRFPATLNQIHLGLLGFGDPAIGYGHSEPPPPFVQLVEGVSGRPSDGIPGGGAAPGCEAVTRTFERNSIETADRAAINAANAGTPVVAAGRAASDVTASSDVAISVDGTVVEDAVVAVNAAARTWRATIPAAALPAADGPVRIEADFAGAFDTIPGADVSTMVLPKDTVAPRAPAADPPAGAYAGARQVTLTAEDGATIHYTNGGAAPTTASPVASGPIAVTATQTLRAIAVDAAGNASPVAVLAYTIGAPGTGGGTTGGGTTATVGGASGGPAYAGPGGAKPLALGLLTARGAIRRTRARREGVRLAMRLKPGTKIVRIRVYRKRRDGARTLLATAFRAPRAAGTYRVRLGDPALRRRLTPGGYEVEAIPGRGRTALGTPSRVSFRVTAR